MKARLSIAGAMFALAGCGEPCDAGELAALLESAASGEVVEAGACRYEGSFDIKPGVTLEGRGRGETFFVAPGDVAAINLLAGAGVAGLRDATVLAAGTVGVLGRGDGEASLERVDILSGGTLGAGFEGLRALTLSEVAIRGEAAASFGLVAIEIADAQLSALEVRGFGAFGTTILGGASVWNGGASLESTGVNSIYSGGVHDLNDVEICDASRSPQTLVAYGVVFAANATITASNLSICRSAGPGMIIDRARASLDALQVFGNDQLGIAIQDADGVELSGDFDDNAGVAVHAIGSRNVRVHDATIGHTRNLTRLIGGTPVEIGDGIELVASSIGARVERVMLIDNARAGALIDLDGAMLEAGTFTDITVGSMAPAGLGVIVQDGTRPADWDATIARDNTVQQNDAALMTELPTVEGVGPCWLPPADLMTNGVSALIGF